MKKLFLFLAFALVSFPSFADEGMWLPSLISERIADMQKKGFRLSAEDIYSINQASLKDAVVHFGGGCTGEIISSQGLLLTNHHCGFGQIQRHSTVENDYLRDGFWAMTMEEELPNVGLTASFLVRMDDVTDAVLKGYKAGMSETERAAIVAENSKKLMDEAVKDGKGLRARVEGLYYGNQYFIFIYKTYRDVRLVGAPPSSIGKFGGDTDNWMWPRHTGDFALFRVYADENNEPADYSENNKPFVPKKHFKVSTKGVKEGDFTFVYGFPGSTRQYITSDAVKYIAERSNPHKIELRTKRLDAQREYMNKDQKVRIQYSSKNAGVANSWKKWQGESKGLIKNNVVEVKEAYEKRFKTWAKGTEYESILDSLENLYAELDPYAFAGDYFRESVFTIELVNFAGRIQTALNAGRDIKPTVESFYKDYYLPIDKKIFVSVVKMFGENVPAEFKPAYYDEQIAKYGSIEKWADDLFDNSVFANKNKTLALTSVSEIENDPAIVFNKMFRDFYNKEISPATLAINRKIQLHYRTYMRGQMEFESNKVFYPDANSTLRVAYGNIAGYKPSDAVYYTPSSSLEGIIEKDNPEIYDYNIPQKLRDIHKEKDFGRWEVDGSVPVCFIATNHTSGGNSGSPVIDADGNLIGLNFDRVWEGTMSDVEFDTEICRNISLDVRYILFIVDKLAGCNRLIEEMDLVN